MKNIILRLKSRTKEIFIYYLIWSLFFLCIAIAWQVMFGNSEAAISIHILLCMTGFPAALGSLYFPHGTIEAIAAAGFLGLAQWTLLSL